MLSSRHVGADAEVQLCSQQYQRTGEYGSGRMRSLYLLIILGALFVICTLSACGDNSAATPMTVGATTPVAEVTLAQTPTPTATSPPISTPTQTPIPTATSALTSTPTPLPTPISTPLPTDAPRPTNTPVPIVKPVLSAESRIAGYSSDGTARVEMTVTLRNEGTLKLDLSQDITATCIPMGDERRACQEKLSLSLPDGFGPASGSFTLRLPMGTTPLELDYGESEILTLDIDVPERILGVDRDLWECYTDRPPVQDFVTGCSGWGTKTVEKWLTDVPVKVWATGDPTYIAVLEAVLAELAPILNMEFEWVDSEAEADFKAFVGVSRSQSPVLGFDYDPNLAHYWGFASAAVNGGEATSGYIVIWHLDQGTFRSSIKSVTTHEALHALALVSHTTRPVSIIGGRHSTH